MAGQPSKEYRARIWVKLSDDLLPQPVLSRSEVEEYLKEALSIGDTDSPIVSVSVDDPVTRKPKRY